MHRPLVSIIIPVYNGSDYVSQAIDSALSQTYQNIEIIVVNDGSNDDGDTENIVLSYGNKIRYIKKENGGVSSALNLGISEMQGDYFSWLSHDDLYYPKKIESQVSIIEKFNRDDLIVMCANQQIDKINKNIGKARICRLPFNEIIDSHNALLYLLNYSCNGCSLLIPKCAFEKSGLFNEKLRYAQDFLMWAQFFIDGFSLVYDNYIGVASRVHEKQLSHTGKNILAHDSNVVADIIYPQLVNFKNDSKSYVYYFAKTNAIHNNVAVVRKGLILGKKYISFIDRIKLNFFCFYGMIRPFIRKFYYKYFKK